MSGLTSYRDNSSNAQLYHICSSSQARESVREIIGGKTESKTRFYISSLAADAERQAKAVRCHWGVENSHHWVMDMRFPCSTALMTS